MLSTVSGTPWAPWSHPQNTLQSRYHSAHFTGEIIEVKYVELELSSLQFKVLPSKSPLPIHLLQNERSSLTAGPADAQILYVLITECSHRPETLQIFQVGDSVIFLCLHIEERLSTRNKPWELYKLTQWSKFILQELLTVTLFTALWISISLVSLLPIKLM